MSKRKLEQGDGGEESDLLTIRPLLVTGLFLLSVQV